MSLRVGIVHERFTEVGGSELVVRELARSWASTRVHAPIVDPAGVPAGLRVEGTGDPVLRRLYPGGGRYAHLLPLLPGAVRRLDLTGSDVVIASHHAFANRLTAPPGVPVVSYAHTPARWMWEADMRRAEAAGRVGGAVLSGFAALERGADRRAAQRMTAIVANSSAVRERVQRWWGRDAVVVHPPVDTGWFSPADVPREDFLLLAGRLVPYKRPEVAVQAAARLDLPLVVAGDGRSRASLEALAGPRTTFLGRVDDETMRDLFRRCRALLFPGEEDFGMVPVEAQACGAPVVALGRGGALDTVVDGVTGVLAQEDRWDADGGMLDAVRRAWGTTFDPAAARSNAERFARDVFVEGMRRVVDDVLLSPARGRV